MNKQLFNRLDPKDELDFQTVHFSYLNTEQLTQLETIKSESYEVIIAFSDLPESSTPIPFRYDPTIHEPYLQKFYKILDNLDRVATKIATLYIYGVPEWLPYFSVYLDSKGWQFKYWLALETRPVENPTAPLAQAHTGILLYVKNKNKFSLRKVRSEHQHCDICGDFTADWGGKKHLRNALGYAISDVWDDLPQVWNENYKLSKEVWQRLIMLTTEEHARILCVAYDGEHDLEQYVFE